MSAQVFVSTDGSNEPLLYTIRAGSGRALSDVLDALCMLSGLQKFTANDMARIKINGEPASSWNQNIVAQDEIRIEQLPGAEPVVDVIIDETASEVDSTEIVQVTVDLSEELANVKTRLQGFLETVESNMKCFEGDIAKLEAIRKNIENNLQESETVIAALMEHVSEVKTTISNINS